MSINISSITHHLSDHTQFVGLKLWITILICIGVLILIILIFTSICYSSLRRRRKKKLHRKSYLESSRRTMDRRLLPRISSPVVYSDRSRWSGSGMHMVDMQPVVFGSARFCKNYSVREIELATNGFNDGNVIESGDGGIVFRGVLFDGKRVAVKELLATNSVNAEEFVEEVEAIVCIRHKNLVKLLGYSIEGSKRMLVYDYLDNGNLHHWLHGCTSRVSPLTRDIRMNIILGVTKGLVYLHEDSEPVVIHQLLKSSSILLDRQWNPKISDVGITKLLAQERSQSIIARPGSRMTGYIAPEYVHTHNFNEKSDVYSFGVLVMEIVSGRTPVEYSEFGKKAYLVDRLKYQIGDQKIDDIIDKRLPELPTLKELKRIILIALRCVDPDVENRPTMGDVIHMLEPRDLLLDDDSVIDI